MTSIIWSLQASFFTLWNKRSGDIHRGCQILLIFTFQANWMLWITSPIYVYAWRYPSIAQAYLWNGPLFAHFLLFVLMRLSRYTPHALCINSTGWAPNIVVDRTRCFERVVLIAVDPIHGHPQFLYYSQWLIHAEIGGINLKRDATATMGCLCMLWDVCIPAKKIINYRVRNTSVNSRPSYPFSVTCSIAENSNGLQG